MSTVGVNPRLERLTAAGVSVLSAERVKLAGDPVEAVRALTRRIGGLVEGAG